MNMLCSRSIRSLPASPFTALYSPVNVRCLSKSQFLTQGQHAAGNSFQSDGPRVLLAWFSPAKRGRQRGEMRANPQINDCFVPKERPHMTHISSHEDCKESVRVRSTGLEFCKVCGVYAIWRGKKKKENHKWDLHFSSPRQRNEEQTFSRGLRFFILCVSRRLSEVVWTISQIKLKKSKAFWLTIAWLCCSFYSCIL